MASIKEIAATCGVSEKTIRNFCSKHGFRKVRNLWEPSEAERKQIYTYYGAEVPKGAEPSEPSEVSSAPFGSTDTAVLEVVRDLRRQLEVKDGQIRDLSTALVAAQDTAKAAQALHAANIQQSALESVEQKQRKWPWNRKSG